MTQATTPVLIAEGKTKQIFEVPGDPGKVRVKSKNDLTAGDGRKHDTFKGKAVYATETTCNVFELLDSCGIATAFHHRLSPDEFLALKCRMLPYEVVARRIALGSYLERNPSMMKGTRFETLVVEFYLKTSGKKFGSITLPCDDPIITSIGPSGLRVHDAHKSIGDEGVNIPHTALGWKADGGADDHIIPFRKMEALARKVFLVLEKAWALQGMTLADLKVEAGITTTGNLVVADVIDNDSWRVLTAKGEHLDKQLYRNDMPLETVKGKYREVAERTKQFQELAKRPLRIVLWCASEKDDLQPFHEAFKRYEIVPGEQWIRTGSMHKAPVRNLGYLRNIFADAAFDTAVIVYVGRSNGAGPVIAGATELPVITVPANWKEFPEDVWSSLRMPSDLPLMMVLDPGNAVLSALAILGIKNPKAYMIARGIRESFWT